MNLSVLELWGAMGWFARGIVVLLFGMSVATVAVALSKARRFGRARRASRPFTAAFAAALEDGAYTEAARLARAHPDSHLAGAFRSALTVLGGRTRGQVSGERAAAIGRLVEANKIQELARLRRGIGALATIGATAPFVGLLGTTMGVVNAFAGMAEAGTGGLAAISGGIAEALVTTAFGLLVAIPAVWLYNYFVNAIELFADEIDFAGAQLMALLLQPVDEDATTLTASGAP